jgi:type I restriction enzyme S subunit
VSSFADDLIHLKNTGSWSGGGTPSKANPAYWEGGTIPWVSPKDMKTFEIVDSQDKITPEAIADSPVRLVPAGSILMVVRSGILAHTFPVAIAKTDVTLNQDMKAITPREGIVSKFLAYQLISQSTGILTNCTKTGTTVSSVETKLLQSLPVWIPEEAKQEAIVADLDKQLSRLDETTSTLQAIQAKLKQARASILKAAVEGRLVETEAELARQSDRCYEDAEELFERVTLQAATQPEEGRKRKGVRASIKPDTEAELPEPPEGWTWVRIDAVGVVQLGRQRTPKDHNGSHMCPYMRVANVFEDRIDLTDVKEMNFTPEEQQTYRLEYGDILLNEGQSPHLVGRPAMWRGEVMNACFQNTLVRFRATDVVLPRYALIVFRAQLHARRYMKIAKITTNIAHLGAQRFGGVEFPLAPLAEQHRIVAEVDRRFSVLDQVEATVNASLKHCSQLRQAVLKRGFGG